jgi:hypothetical protein
LIGGEEVKVNDRFEVKSPFDVTALVGKFRGREQGK